MRHRGLGLLLIGLLAALPALAGECRSKRAAAIDALESRTGGLLIPAVIGRHPTYLTLDTGGSANLLFADVVAVEGLHTQPSLRSVVGAGGSASNLIVIDHQRSYFVVPRGAGGDLRDSGTLGTGYYQGRDLEIDFPGRKIRLVSPQPCVGQPVAWARDYRIVPIRLDQYGRAFATVILDGQPLTALIDTGASDSVLSREAALRLFRVWAGGPGTVAGAATIDADGTALPTWRGQFRRLDLGGIAFDRPWLDLSASGCEPGIDMILGMQQLRWLHLYFAFAEHRLYASSSGR